MAKRDKADTMDQAVRVQLTDEQKARKGEQLADKLGLVKALRDQKKAEGDRLQGMIDEALDAAEELRLEILEGEQEKRQGALFVDDKVVGRAPGEPPAVATRVTDETAKNVLRKIAEKAGEKGDGAPAS